MEVASIVIVTRESERLGQARRRLAQAGSQRTGRTRIAGFAAVCTGVMPRPKGERWYIKLQTPGPKPAPLGLASIPPTLCDLGVVCKIRGVENLGDRVEQFGGAHG